MSYSAKFRDHNQSFLEASLEHTSPVSTPETAAEPEVPGPHLPGARWTFGDSNALVEGRDRESIWTSVAWLVVPALLAAAVLVLMGRL